jgi:hypothetical protein
MNFDRQAGEDTRECPQNKYCPMFLGLDGEVTLIEKHGTGLSENEEADDHVGE